MHYLRIENGNVVGEHFEVDSLTDEQKAMFTPVESIPEPEQSTGKLPVLKYDGTKLYFEYVDAPVDEMTTLKKQLTVQSQKLAEQEQAIMELTTLLAGGTTNV